MSDRTSELSEPLRKQYRSALINRGTGGSWLVGAIVYFTLAYGCLRWLPDQWVDQWGWLVVLTSLVAGAAAGIGNRLGNISDARLRVEKMPDDQLTVEYEDYRKSGRLTDLVIYLALGAVAFGLVFTPQGQAIVHEVLG